MNIICFYTLFSVARLRFVACRWHSTRSASRSCSNLALIRKAIMLSILALIPPVGRALFWL